MNDNDALDKWLKHANKELIESISNSLDIDDALATVKYRANTELDEASSDRYLAELLARACGRVLSLSVIRAAHRSKRVVSAMGRALVGLFRSRGLFAVIGAAVATGIFVLSFPLFSSQPPINSLGTFAERVTNDGTDDGGDDGAENHGQGGDQRPDQAPTRPSLGHPPTLGPTSGEPTPEQSTPEQPIPGQSTPEEPASRKPGSGQPAEPEQSATEVPTPGYFRVDPPGGYTEKTVELTTQEGQNSVQIDRWETVSNEPDDLHMDQDGIYTILGAALSLVDPSIEPTYQHCSQNTTWTNRVNFTSLQEGSRLCAKSHTGRYAVLTVDVLPVPAENNDRFVFHGRTWQSAGQPAPRHTPSSEPTTEHPTPPPVTGVPG